MALVRLMFAVDRSATTTPAISTSTRAAARPILARRDVIIRRPPPEAQSVLGWDSTLLPAPRPARGPGGDSALAPGSTPSRAATPRAVRVEGRLAGAPAAARGRG